MEPINDIQEAFNIIVKNCGCNGITKIQCINCDIPTCKVACSLSDIKELIDNYSKLEKALDLACKYLEIKSNEILSGMYPKMYPNKYINIVDRGNEIEISNKTSDEWKNYLLEGWKQEMLKEIEVLNETKG